MIEKAYQKMEQECKASKNRPELVAIKTYLKERIKKDPVAAEAVLDEKKTLSDAYKAMLEVAKKRRIGNSYCMAPDEAWKIIDGYYGFTGGSDAEKTEESQTPVKADNVVSIFDLI